jgi:hypothetical protein
MDSDDGLAFELLPGIFYSRKSPSGMKVPPSNARGAQVSLSIQRNVVLQASGFAPPRRIGQQLLSPRGYLNRHPKPAPQAKAARNMKSRSIGFRAIGDKS